MRFLSTLVARAAAASLTASLLSESSDPFLFAAAASSEAENARWLIQTSTWATLSWMDGGSVSSMVVSHAEKDGDVYINIPDGEEFHGALTFSEAQIDPSQFEGARCGPDGALDPEDPRCAKLTVSGTFRPVEGADADAAREVIFATHPEMRSWPEDHGFVVLRLEVSDVWMIANFGGGGSVPTAEYHAAQPKRHAVRNFGDRRRTSSSNVDGRRRRRRRLERPAFGTDAAAHARWLVSESLWTIVSTNASERAGADGRAFGNVRSTHDGECLRSSSGAPVFYLPSPDPSNVDVLNDPSVSLSFTEANLADLVASDGSICDGLDPENPSCAKISLRGTARPLTDDELGYTLRAFSTTHPRGAWLSSGGGHTGGTYYTIDIKSIEFFRDFGGPAELAVADYMAWEPTSASDYIPPSDLACDARTVVPLSSESGGDMGGGHEHEHGGGMGGGHEHGEGMWQGHGGMGGGHEHGEGMGQGHEHGEGMWQGHEHGEGMGQGHEHEHGEGMWQGHEHGEGTGGGHGHGDGMGGGHGEGMGQGHVEGMWRGHDEGEEGRRGDGYGTSGVSSSSSYTEEEKSSVTLTSFVLGMFFGLVVWGPTVAVFVYFKYHRGTNGGNDDVRTRKVSSTETYQGVAPTAQVV